MKFIIKESQHKFLLEQSEYLMDKRANAIANVTGIRSNKDYKSIDKLIDKAHQGKPIDPHTLMTILQIGTAFIPVVGPFISAGIGLADAAMYYKEGDKNAAGLTAAFSMIPFAGKIINKIPGVKQLGSKGMASLASKLSSGGKNLTMAEKEIAEAIKKYSPEIQEELSKMGPKLSKIVKEVNANKSNFIKKYGEDEYNKLLTKYLYDGIDKKTFVNTLKNVKNPNIKIKPLLGGGQDHRVYQIISNPNQIVKVEIRPGQVEQWYNTFKKNPDFFPKIFRKTKVKGQDGKLLDAVILEKLNTKPFMDLWGKLESSLHKSQRLLPHNEQTVNLEYMLKRLKTYPHLNKKWSNLIKTIKSESPELSGKVDEFDKIINRWYEITPNPDIRKFNLGYDSNGVLKVLDI
jgi:hypothetical protein